MRHASHTAIHAAALTALVLTPAFSRAAHSQALISQGDPVTGSLFYNQGTETFTYQNITDGRFNDTGTPGNWSFWLTPNGQTGYATIDLGSTFSISQFVLQDTHNRGYNDRGTNAFDISISNDGVSFAPVLSDAFSQTAWSNLSLLTETNLPPTVGRYVKFNIDTYYGSSGGLNELQVYGTPAPEPAQPVALGMAGILSLALRARRRGNV